MTIESASQNVTHDTFLEVGAVVSFCTYDFRYLSASLNGLLPFARSRLVVTCDHFFDGMPEEYALLEAAYAAHPNVRFVEVAFDPEKPYGFSSLYPGHPEWIRHWHNTARYAGFLSLPSSTDYVLFLDADEILEGAQVADWLCKTVLQTQALRFQGYYYFREARFRATTRTPYGLLIPKKRLHSAALFDEDERRGVYLRHGGDPETAIGDDTPFLHHYSWVRTEEETMRKVRSWGHSSERDWERIFTQEFSTPFQMKDCVRGYTYEEVSPFFDPLATPIPNLPKISLQEHLHNIKSMPHVERVDNAALFRRSLYLETLCTQIPTST